MSAPLAVVSWLWSGATMGHRVEYCADHVNRLYSMVSRHLSIPHRFFCVTDMPEGLHPDINVVPLWDDLRQYGRCYTRLKLFDPVMRDIFGPRVLSLDLDAVIVGSLDPIVDTDAPFAIWKAAHPSDPNVHTPYCGSMWLLEISFMPEVYHDFDPEIACNLRKTHGFVGSDQAWMSYMIPTDRAHRWTQEDGIYSFRFDFSNPFGRNMMAGNPLMKAKKARIQGMHRKTLPENARAVFFHGVDDPSQTHLHIRHKWIPQHWH